MFFGVYDWFNSRHVVSDEICTSSVEVLTRPADTVLAMQRYEANMSIYRKAFAEYKDSGKADAWKRDPEKPKQPLTGSAMGREGMITEGPSLLFAQGRASYSSRGVHGF